MRYQVGDFVPLWAHMEIETYGQLRPGAAVRATVVDDSDDSVVETIYLHPVNIFTTPALFQGRIETNNGLYSAGRYRVYITSQVIGLTVGTTRSFVLESGSSSGSIMGLVDYRFQTGEHAVFQRDDGSMLVGRRPR